MPTRKKLDEQQERRLREIKKDLCVALIRLYVRNGWTRQTMAIRLKTTPTRISTILTKNTYAVTFNQLFKYLILAEPRFEVLIAI